MTAGVVARSILRKQCIYNENRRKKQKESLFGSPFCLFFGGTTEKVIFILRIRDILLTQSDIFFECDIFAIAKVKKDEYHITTRKSSNITFCC